MCAHTHTHLLQMLHDTQTHQYWRIPGQLHQEALVLHKLVCGQGEHSGQSTLGSELNAPQSDNLLSIAKCLNQIGSN